MGARDHMKRKAEAIDKEKREKEKLEKFKNNTSYRQGADHKPFGGSAIGSSANNGNSFGGFNVQEPESNRNEEFQQQTISKPKKSRKRPQGMRLGGTREVNMDLAKALAEEKNTNPFGSMNQSEQHHAQEETENRMDMTTEKVD